MRESSEPAGSAGSCAERTRPGGQVSTGTLPAPLRDLAAQLNELRSGDIRDMGQAVRILVELAAAAEFFDPLIAQTRGLLDRSGTERPVHADMAEAAAVAVPAGAAA